MGKSFSTGEKTLYFDYVVSALLEKSKLNL
jgi:hypothetical protein